MRVVSKLDFASNIKTDVESSNFHPQESTTKIDFQFLYLEFAANLSPDNTNRNLPHAVFSILRSKHNPSFLQFNSR